MPARSEQQQKLFGLALSVKRGETPRSEASPEILKIVDTMSEKDIEDFAGTKHTGLPTKVEQKLRETIREMLKNDSINEADVVGKTVFSDGKGKLFFGYYKDDDGVTFVDYKTWAKLRMKDVSKGDTNKDRVIKAILQKQKQFNKKVEYNMWSKKTNPSFEEKMDWFIKNGWISNINKGGIRENVESVNEAASRTAMEIGGLTGMNKDAIQKFVDDNNLDIEKVFRYVKKGNFIDRMDLVSAIAGKPNNPVQKKMIKMFKESVNEAVSKTYKIPTQRGTLHIEVEEDPAGVFVDVIFNRVDLTTTDIQFPTGEVKVTQRQKRVKLKESVMEGKKRFYQQDRVGSAKYTISYHDGKQKHKDGSDFYGIQTFRNKQDLEKFRTALLKKGYREDSGFKKESVNENIKSIDNRELKRFIDYMNDFYGKRGVYSSGKDLKPNEVIKALNQVFKKNKKYEWGGGDSVDREFTRDELMKMGVLSDEIYKKESVNEANFKGKNWFFTTFSDGDIRGDIKVSKTAIWKLTNAGNSLGIGGQFTLMDAGKVRGKVPFPKNGNLAQLAKRMYDTAQKETTYGVDKNIKEKDILDGLRGYYKAWASKSNESVNESIKYKDVKKGDVLYSWIYGSKKGGKQEREYYKVKILEPISDEPGYERFSAKQLDGLRKGKTVVVWLDTLSKKANESVNEAKVELELDLFKNYNQRKPDKTIKISASTSTRLSQLAKSLRPKFEKQGYDYIEFHYGDKFLGSMMAGTDDYSFKKGRGLSGSGFRESVQ